MLASCFFFICYKNSTQTNRLNISECGGQLERMNMWLLTLNILVWFDAKETKDGTKRRKRGREREQLCNRWKIVRLCWLFKANHSYAYLRLFVIVKRRKTGNACGVWARLWCQISPIINELGELVHKVCAQDGFEWEPLTGTRRGREAEIERKRSAESPKPLQI